jgi:hypothetical protein
MKKKAVTIAEVAQDLAHLEVKVDGIGETVNTMQEDVQEIKILASRNQADIQDIKRDMQGVKSLVNRTQEDVQGVKSLVRRNQKDIQEIKNLISNLPTKEDLDVKDDLVRIKTVLKDKLQVEI